ncbi:MAG: hypothetical protein AMXMBFR33_46480 [Candidatus Xenobia bacterium]|jgi:nucleotide-binding universal stress UspA family protein
MYKTILVTLDGSALAEQALPHAEQVAHGAGAELILLQVISLSNIGQVTLDTEVPIDFPSVEQRLKAEASEYLESKAAPLAAKGIKTRTMVARGGAATAIMDVLEREKVDLIVLTSHGRSGLSKWVHGSTAAKILDKSTCPVLLIRSK